MVKVLILGANGQLGKEFLKKKYARPTVSITGLGRDELDLSDYALVREYLEAEAVDVIINCSGYTAVDLAEIEEDKAFQVNAEIPENLAKICQSKGIPLIHFSTDYVFDGENKVAYLESDSIHPLNVYGSSKAEGEKKVLANCDFALVIRVAWLYSAQGKNFFLSMLRLGREKNQINIVNDQLSSPTYAGFLVEDLLNLIEKKSLGQELPAGLYHYSCEGTCSWMEFAQEILEKDDSTCIVESISSEEFGAAAVRPKHSKLDNSLWLQKTSLPTRTWLEGLYICYSEYCETHGNGKA